MKLEFYKVESSGNDFIIIDNTSASYSRINFSKIFREICERKRSVGADGVLLLEKDSPADFRMRIFNSDGGEVEMCGNGARCCAYYHFLKTGSRKMRFTTKAGVMEAAASKSGMVKLGMPPPSGTSLDMLLKIGADPISVSYINTGVPHAVIETDRVNSLDVENIGRTLRHHREFAPEGTNVDFAEVTGPSEIKMRTYERGVEGETLACGTGAVACAVITGLKGKTSPPVNIETRGGDILKVHFKMTDSEDLLSRVYDVKLEGRVRVVFKGEMEI